MQELKEQIREWAREMGFQQTAVSDVALADWRERLQHWLAQGYHGEMEWMERHADKRGRPELLFPGVARAIVCRMDYLPAEYLPADQDPELASVSRYALGRDYHKLMRRRLARLARRIRETAGGGRFRAFVDSAPVPERALAAKAGLGWVGKNTMLINRNAGSWFFLGVIYTDLPLPVDAPYKRGLCGSCRACLDLCPTRAFTGPGELDARRCISYLTIEYKGSIPAELRPLIGNRIFGCDECQRVCPWNRYAQISAEPDFQPRQRLDRTPLHELFAWSEEEFLRRTEGSALRRLRYECWLRNLAVALGNAPPSTENQKSLQARSADPSALVREHVRWALEQHRAKSATLAVRQV